MKTLIAIFMAMMFMASVLPSEAAKGRKFVTQQYLDYPYASGQQDHHYGRNGAWE